MSTDLAFLRLHAFGRLWAIGRLAPQQSAPWVPDAPSPSTDGPPMMRCISAWSARRSFINASTPTGLAPCPRFSASQSFSSPTTRPRSPLTRPGRPRPSGQGQSGPGGSALPPACRPKGTCPTARRGRQFLPAHPASPIPQSCFLEVGSLAHAWCRLSCPSVLCRGSDGAPRRAGCRRAAGE